MAQEERKAIPLSDSLEGLRSTEFSLAEICSFLGVAERALFNQKDSIGHN